MNDKNMPATTEDLLLQILELEETIKTNIKLRKDTSILQERLIVLKEQFELLNETLNKPSKVLKG